MCACKGDSESESVIEIKVMDQNENGKANIRIREKRYDEEENANVEKCKHNKQIEYFETFSLNFNVSQSRCVLYFFGLVWFGIGSTWLERLNRQIQSFWRKI